MLSDEKSMDHIELKVKNYIINNKLLSKGDSVLLAISAGKDSMAMLNVFLNLRHFFNIEIKAFHLNHMLRGNESDKDEDFVKNRLKKENISLICKRFDFVNERDPKTSFEEQARNIRYNLLKQILDEEKCNKIATAHNFEDNIETILMRIFTGTGLLGLGGIENKRDNIIRPLLELSISDIYEYLKRNKVEWREDESNKSNDYSRNYIRNILIPGIRERFPMVESSLMNLSRISSDTICLIEELMVDKVKDLFHYENKSLFISTKDIGRSKNLFNYIIIKLLREHFNFYCNSMVLNEMHRIFQQEKSNNNLYKNNEIIVEKVYKDEKVWIKVSKPGMELEMGHWEYCFDLNKDYNDFEIKEIGIKINLRFVDYDYFLKNKNNNKYIFVTLNDKNDSIIIRNRKKGDIISLNYGTKKIRDLLIEKKLDNLSKSIIPLLIVNSNIAAFMPGLVFNIKNKTSKDYIVNKDSKKVLAIEGKT